MVANASPEESGNRRQCNPRSDGNRGRHRRRIPPASRGTTVPSVAPGSGRAVVRRTSGNPRSSHRHSQIAPVCSPRGLAKTMEKPTPRLEGGCMNCDEAAEFASALSDGETIPREAAKHVGECARCRARLLEYAEMGAELRRLSSLQLTDEEKAPRWQKTQSATPNLWRKGSSTVRMPTAAFALMLVAIIALASSLTIVKVRAHSHGVVLMLTAETASGRTVRCALSFDDRRLDSCASEQIVTGVRELYGFRIISRDGDRIELGVRAKRGS